jgi:hypothetical protein
MLVLAGQAEQWRGRKRAHQKGQICFLVHLVGYELFLLLTEAREGYKSMMLMTMSSQS